KVPNKRNNTVFKDPGSHPVAETGITAARERQLSSGDDTSTADVPEEPEIAAVNTAPSPKPAEDVKVNDASKPHVDFSDLVSSDKCPALRSDGVYIGDCNDIKAHGNNPRGNGVKVESRPSV